MTTLKILVFIGSVRPGRMAERLGKFIETALENHSMQPIIIDPMTLSQSSLELNQTPLHFYSDPESDAPSWMKDLNECIRRASGFLILCSEYNCGIPPALSNLLNTFPPWSYKHRPVGIISYSTGNFGAVRVISVLRPYLTELGMIVVPAYATIPLIQETLDEDGNVVSNGFELKNIDKVLTEIKFYAKAIKAYSVNHPLPS
ncbi:FMN-dependent NADPH-azoreductase [Orchesella cincta]|uniref:FMN-dependent NADPH-azoreductase n=1 Tax=Orchesella cincta TaxID=48709 RepID=A0A1D2MVN4_ORCCI|nr:FMN-dependent NADPH-azoreductase [Orchesella cincta]